MHHPEPQEQGNVIQPVEVGKMDDSMPIAYLFIPKLNQELYFYHQQTKSKWKKKAEKCARH